MKHFLLILFLCISPLLWSGFSSDTIIKGSIESSLIKNIEPSSIIVTWDNIFCKKCHGKIHHKKSYQASSYAILVFDNEYIIASLDQKFYLPVKHEWQDARFLKKDDLLWTLNNCYIPLQDIYFIHEDIEIIEIEVEDTHTFFVGQNGILVHNNPAIAVIFIAEATPIVVEAAISVGTTLATWYAAKFVQHVLDPERVKKENILEKDTNNDAQAPGMPTADDGYEPPKRWDGKKVRNPNGPGFGWPDNKGRVWIPSGPNSHGGPHWDVETPDGGYDNIVPGGGRRGVKR